MTVLLLIVLVTTLGFTVAPNANAHSVLEGTDPAAGATLRKPPTQLVLTFSAKLREQGSALIVSGPQGRAPVSATISGNIATAPWPTAFDTGPYRVDWRVVSVDGHVMSGSWDFRVRPSRKASNPASPAASSVPLTPEGPSPEQLAAAPESEGVPAALWIVVIAALAAGLLLIWRNRSRHGT